jgi:hypothetical protein
MLRRRPGSEVHARANLRRRAHQALPPLDRRTERRPTRPA